MAQRKSNSEVYISLLSMVKDASLRQILAFMLAIGTVTAPMAKGVWEFGVENRWWGEGKGAQETVNLRMMRLYFGRDPKLVVRLIDTPEDVLVAKIYESGDAALIRNTAGASGVTYQQITWVTKKKAEEYVKSTKLSLVSEANAAEVVSLDFSDEVIGWVDAYTVRVKRIFPNKCYQILLIDAGTGSIKSVEHSTC